MVSHADVSAEVNTEVSRLESRIMATREFPPKGYLIAAVFSVALALVAVLSAIGAGQPAVLLLAAFWIVICVLCVRSWRSAR
jgi:hypothetical protein